MNHRRQNQPSTSSSVAPSSSSSSSWWRAESVARDKLFESAATKLLERAAETYNLKAEDLTARLARTTEKYLFAYQCDASEAEAMDFVASLAADDVCLATACERGNETAWRDLITRYESTVRAAARRATKSETEAEDLTASLWSELYGWRATATTTKTGASNSEPVSAHEDEAFKVSGSKPSGKLIYYSGCGSLAGFLRAVVVQLAADNHRRTRRLVQLESETEMDFAHVYNNNNGKSNDARISFTNSLQVNPEEDLRRTQQTKTMHKCVAAALSKLTDEDRLLIKLYYFDGLRLREAGAVLGFHEATASRRLSRAHEQIKLDLTERLRREYDWQEEDIKEAFAFAASNSEFDVAPLLELKNLPIEKSGNAEPSN